MWSKGALVTKVPMPDFPFPWLHHGPFETESLDKCEEVFLWFERPVTVDERARIEAGCPAPLADVYAWGDTWVYFGSPGDSYDSLIRFGYAGLAEDASVEELQALYEDDDALNRAVDAFAEALEAWVRKAHTIVPIAFFFGPSATDPDAWGRWSEAKVRELWTRVSAVAPAAEEEDDAHPARYLGYIRGIVARLVAEHGDPAEVAAELYALDGIRGPVHRLSYEESRLHTNGSLLSRALGKGKGRAKKLATWPPYIQLAYLASYTALDEEDLTTFEDPVATLRTLVDALPPERQPAGAHLLAFIADAWVHNTPAFNKPRKKYAKLATAILELACSRPEATAEMFVNATGYADLAHEPAWMLALGQAGLARFPSEPLLWSNTITAARLVGDEELEHTLAEALLTAPLAADDEGRGLEVVAIQLNNLGRPADVLQRVDPERVTMTTTLWECWTWASVLIGTAPQARQALDTFAARHKEKKLSADTAENLALLHFKLAEDEAGTKRLKEALKGGKKAKELRKAKEWAPYLELAGVRALLD